MVRTQDITPPQNLDAGDDKNDELIEKVKSYIEAWNVHQNTVSIYCFSHFTLPYTAAAPYLLASAPMIGK